MRAAANGMWRRYAVAGAGGRSRSRAKYNGAVAIVAVITTVGAARVECGWSRPEVFGRTSRAAAAFLCAPLTLLDLPAFLKRVCGAGSEISPGIAHLPEPAWPALSEAPGCPQSSGFPQPRRGYRRRAARSARVRWAPAVLFALAYSTFSRRNPLVFGRYALPLLPIYAAVVCLLGEVAGAVTRTRPGRSNRAPSCSWGSLVLTTNFAVQSLGG